MLSLTLNTTGITSENPENAPQSTRPYERVLSRDGPSS